MLLASFGVEEAKVEVTLRNGMVRISPALFNNTQEIDRCLAVTKALL